MVPGHLRGKNCVEETGAMGTKSARVFCAGTGFRVFARDAFVRERDFVFFHGTTGYGIRDFPFFTGHGIRDSGFRILALFRILPWTTG